MNAAVESQVNAFGSKANRDLIILEAKNDPEFERQLLKVLKLPDGEDRIVVSAHKAVLNELNPMLYPEMAGSWPILRSVILKVIERVGKSTSDDISSIPKDYKQKGLGDFGQYDFLGPLLNTIISTGSSLYGSYSQQSTARDLERMRLQANMEAVKAQEAMAAAQTAIAHAQTSQAINNYLPASIAGPAASVVEALTSDLGGGITVWEALIAAYFIFKFKG